MPGIKKCNKELLYKVHQVLPSVAINRVCHNTGKVVFSQVIKFQILKIWTITKTYLEINRKIEKP